MTPATRSACRRPTTPTTSGFRFFYSALNETGRAGFVMANSAGDARGSELEIRRKLLKSEAVDVMVSVGLELLLHGHFALHALVLRPGQSEDEPQGQGALHRRPPHLSAD